MSKGAMSELLKASLGKFEKMVKNVPKSERKEIIQTLENHVEILEDIR